MLKRLSYLLVFVVLVAGVAATAHAQSGSPDNATLKLTAEPSKGSYLQGEPIPIKVTLTNISSAPVSIVKAPLDYIVPGWDLRGDVKNPSGKYISISPGIRHQMPYEIKPADFVTLAPGQSLDWTITAEGANSRNKDLTWDASQPDGSWRTSDVLGMHLSDPGTYTLSLTLMDAVQSPSETSAWTGTLSAPAVSITITAEKFQKAQ